MVQFLVEGKLSNEELMQTREEFGLVTLDPEKDRYNKDATIPDFMQNILIWNIYKIKGNLNEAEEHITKLGTVQKLEQQ